MQDLVEKRNGILAKIDIIINKVESIDDNITLCKNYTSVLGNTPVQEVSAGKLFYGCHIGVVMTNSTFTSGAVSLAKATGVLLWDRTVLSKLMKTESAIKNNKPQRTESHSVTPPSNNYVLPRHPAHVLSETEDFNESQSAVNEQPIQNKRVRIDSIDIEIDLRSFHRFNIAPDNFGIEMDEDDESSMELLFDVIGKSGRKLPCTVDIVCNLYAGNRKVVTEKVAVYDDSFHTRDSLSVYFDKKNICKIATKIEIYCQKW